MKYGKSLLSTLIPERVGYSWLPQSVPVHDERNYNGSILRRELSYGIVFFAFWTERSNKGATEPENKKANPEELA